MTTTASVARERDYTALSLRRRAGWVVLLGSLTALGAFTIDLYLPAFPVLQRELHASASSVQLTLTGTMVGAAVGQLVVGPLSDALGRRRPLLAGLVLHLLASVACALAPSVAVLGVLRVLQGLGTAAATVIALAVVRDRFDGSGAARLLARLMLVIGASPVLAPSLGSALLGVTDWRGIFILLAVMSLALGAAVVRLLPETLPVRSRRRAGPRSMASAYVDLLRDRAVLGLVVVAGLTMAALFGYVSGSSFVFQEQFGLSHGQFGLVFALGGVAIVAGTQTNGSLVHRFSPVALLTTGLAAGAVSAVVVLAAAITGAFGLVGVLVPLCAAMFFLGLVQPSAPVLALERHGEAAGSSAAVLGCAQFGVAAVAAPLSGLLGLSPATAMGAVMTTGLVLALVLFVAWVRPALRTAPRPLTTAALPPRPRAQEPAREVVGAVGD